MHYTVQAHFYSVDEKNDQANSRFLCFNDVIFYNIITGFHLNTCCHNNFAFFLFCVLCNDIYDTSARTFSLKVWCRRSNNLATSEKTNMARQLYTLREVKKSDFDTNLGANLSDNSRVSEDLGRITCVCRKC